jgi:hypothetical protein
MSAAHRAHDRFGDLTTVGTMSLQFNLIELV